MRALRVNETKLTSRNAFCINHHLSIFFALESESELKYDQKTFFWDSSWSLICLLTLSLRTTLIGVFPHYLSFSQFIGRFLLLLENKKTKFMKFCIIFHLKQANILTSMCTSLLLCSKPVQCHCLHFFKIFKRRCGL